MQEIMEIEYKMLISKEIYEQMKEDFKSKYEDNYKQTNYYFTHPLFESKEYMLRIREKKGRYELTLKRPSERDRIETTEFIDEQTKDKIINHQKVTNKIMTILEDENISYKDIEQAFKLTTYRHDYKLNYGTLSLDYNEYGHIHDYELEYEVFDKENGYCHFLELIRPYHLTYTKNSPNKVVRAMKAKESENHE